jgi:hypothetical protein
MDARLTQRRILLCALAIVALVSTTTACGGGSDAHAAAKDPLAKYTGSGLSFSYPAEWTASKPILPVQDLHFHPLVYLSTQAVHAPCTTNGNETSCGLPIDSLQPGGVLAYWQYNELPLTGPITLTGKKIQVDGHPAGVKSTASGECQGIGADRTVEADVDLGNDSLIHLTACLRGPGLAKAEKSIDALLASTKFTSQ